MKSVFIQVVSFYTPAVPLKGYSGLEACFVVGSHVGRSLLPQFHVSLHCVAHLWPSLENQDWDEMGMGVGMEEFSPSSIFDQASENEGVIFPWCHPPSCHHPAGPLHPITLPTTIEVERISLKAQISEEIASLSKDLAFKRRVNHISLLISFMFVTSPFHASSPVNIFSPAHEPFLENLHHSPRGDASTTLSTFLNLSYL